MELEASTLLDHRGRLRHSRQIYKAHALLIPTSPIISPAAFCTNVISGLRGLNWSFQGIPGHPVLIARNNAWHAAHSTCDCFAVLSAVALAATKKSSRHANTRQPRNQLPWLSSTSIAKQLNKKLLLWWKRHVVGKTQNEILVKFFDWAWFRSWLALRLLKFMWVMSLTFWGDWNFDVWVLVPTERVKVSVWVFEFGQTFQGRI